MFHHFKTCKRRRGNTSGKDTALKVDMEKTYDRVEWEFLLQILIKRGFDLRWVQWIRACITTVSYQVLLNGKKTEVIRPSKGIRQGDSLSPYLFILVVDVLSRRLEQSITTRQIIGIRPRRTCLEIHHLLFADDALFFIKGSLENAQALKHTIDEYC